MTPLGHRIALVPWSIGKGESGFGWVAAVGQTGDSEVGVVGRQQRGGS